MTAVRSNFLRIVTALDAAACGAMGVGFAFAAPMLSDLLGLSPALMQPVGYFLIAYAAMLAWLAARPAIPGAVVWSLVAFNIVWGLESIAMVVLGQIQPTNLGVAAVIGQGIAALIVADLQFLSVRRAARLAA